VLLFGYLLWRAKASDTIILGVISGVVSLAGLILTAWVNVKLSRVHREVNGMKTELVNATKILGIKEGRDQVIHEQEEKKPTTE